MSVASLLSAACHSGVRPSPFGRGPRTDRPRTALAVRTVTTGAAAENCCTDKVESFVVLLRPLPSHGVNTAVEGASPPPREVALGVQASLIQGVDASGHRVEPLADLLVTSGMGLHLSGSSRMRVGSWWV
jgi:hypothetical protein